MGRERPNGTDEAEGKSDYLPQIEESPDVLHTEVQYLRKGPH